MTFRQGGIGSHFWVPTGLSFHRVMIIFHGLGRPRDHGVGLL